MNEVYLINYFVTLIKNVWLNNPSRCSIKSLWRNVDCSPADGITTNQLIRSIRRPNSFYRFEGSL